MAERSTSAAVILLLYVFVVSDHAYSRSHVIMDNWTWEAISGKPYIFYTLRGIANNGSQFHIVR